MVHGLTDGLRNAKSSNLLQFHITRPFFPNYHSKGCEGELLQADIRCSLARLCYYISLEDVVGAVG
ncbi:MAG: hypothetical protein CMJ81_10160 [Planctomycetaceae bacterium]|nr:hypothetical protein [Planctomycetaceae bacterium]MBP60052.1 hypothetical protein [Planctomycetaceae bacterium]